MIWIKHGGIAKTITGFCKPACAKRNLLSFMETLVAVQIGKIKKVITNKHKKNYFKHAYNLELNTCKQKLN